MKLLGQTETFREALRPFHRQLNLTNECQLNCSFCSCRDRKDDTNTLRGVMDIADLRTYLDSIPSIRACTLTGGGEPLLYPAIREAVKMLSDRTIKVGLVTNGIALHRLDPDTLTRIDWIRVSFDTNRAELPIIPSLIPPEKLAWSFVVSDPGGDVGNPR